MALYMKTNIHFVSYLFQFFLEREMFQTKFVEKIKTHFVFSNFFPTPCSPSGAPMERGTLSPEPVVYIFTHLLQIA